MLFLKFLLAMLPIIWLIVALSVLKMAGHRACVIALLITVALSMGYWKLKAIYVATAALEGALNALWPICLVIIAALFTYNLSLKTGAMEKIKQMLASVSTDQRVLLLLIGWGFGNFMEGMAGFGTAVAIPASMLVGIGLDPFSAVVSCLVVNSTPTAFGSVGVPTVTLSNITNLDVLTLSGNAALIQCILTFISPFLMVCIAGKGVKALKGMIPTTFIASVSFVIPWFISAKVIGCELPDIIGAIISMVCIIAAAKVFNKEPDPNYSIEVQDKQEASGKRGKKVKEAITLSEGLKAWSSFILIFILLMLTSNLCPPIQKALSVIKSSVVVYAGPDGNTLNFSWVNTPGVIIFIAAIIGGFIQKATVGDMVQVLVETLKKYWRTILTICSVMATAKIMTYSGMITDIAKLLVEVAGPFYPLIAPLIGAIGGFITGSGTSTCVLFGGLQVQTAAELSLNPTWMAAANVMGAGIGKMICPQGIAIGAGAANVLGSESKILGAVFKYFVLYVVVAGIICYAGSVMGF